MFDRELHDAIILQFRKRNADVSNLEIERKLKKIKNDELLIQELAENMASYETSQMNDGTSAYGGRVRQYVCELKRFLDYNLEEYHGTEVSERWSWRVYISSRE